MLSPPLCLRFPNIQNLSGTLSIPPLKNGLQRIKRFAARIEPLIIPNFWIAAIAYDEHVGVNLQHGGVKGEIYFL